MKVEDAVAWFGVIEQSEDGSQSSRDRAQRLNESLLKQPENFVETYFDSMRANDPIRIKAEALVRSGAVTTESTFADLKNVMQGQESKSTQGDNEL